MYIIYLIYNTINEKMYVGKTSLTEHKRWKQHKINAKRTNKKKDTYFYKAIRKHGEDKFSLSILSTAITNEEACNQESLYIGLLKTYNPVYGYNGTFGGEGSPFTEEAKKKSSEKHKGNRNPMFGKIGILNPLYGRKRPKEVVEKMIATKKASRKSRIIKKSYKKGRSDVATEQIQNLYQKGYSLRRVGKILNISSNAVLDRLKKAGTSTRPNTFLKLNGRFIAPEIL